MDSGLSLLNKAVGEMNYDPSNHLLGELAAKAYKLRCLYILRKIDLSVVNLPSKIKVYMKNEKINQKDNVKWLSF